MWPTGLLFIFLEILIAQLAPWVHYVQNPIVQFESTVYNVHVYAAPFWITGECFADWVVILHIYFLN